MITHNDDDKSLRFKEMTMSIWCTLGFHAIRWAKPFKERWVTHSGIDFDKVIQEGVCVRADCGYTERRIVDPGRSRW